MKHFENISDAEFDRILRMIGKAVNELNELPKLEYPELTGELNDLLWTYDGITEATERMKKENDSESIAYYTKGINNRYSLIRKKYLHLLN